MLQIRTCNTKDGKKTGLQQIPFVLTEVNSLLLNSFINSVTNLCNNLEN